MNEPASPPSLRWIDAGTLPLQGRAWADVATFYDRLPARAKGIVREPVWRLGQDSAGLFLHFKSNTTALKAKWSLRQTKLEMLHMPASGVSGLDLYVRRRGQWRWMSAARPVAAAESEATLFERLAPIPRELRLYLPLYNGIASLQLGLTDDCQLAPVEASGRPIVFYGTSIVQGACVSRPGMAYPSILGRRLETEVINLGFSGNGKAEPEMARLLAEIDCALYVVDCLPNLGNENAHAVAPFIQTLRSKRPVTPILLVEHLGFPDGDFVPARHLWCYGANQVLRQIFDRCAAEDSNLHYLASTALLGDDGEGTVDGTHPSDLGMIRMADAMEGTLRCILARDLS